ncbi:hypothetical protein D9M71_665870 [compost metagenome]
MTLANTRVELSLTGTTARRLSPLLRYWTVMSRPSSHLYSTLRESSSASPGRTSASAAADFGSSPPQAARNTGTATSSQSAFFMDIPLK